MINTEEPDIKDIVDINSVTTGDIIKMGKEQVKLVQKQLVDLGANLGKTGPNNDGADGDWGRISRAAFSFYKQGNDLKDFVPPPPIKKVDTSKNPYQKSNALKDVLKEFVISAVNSSASKYKGGNLDYWSTIGSKFPDLQGYDPELLNAYASTIDHQSFATNPNAIPRIADVNWEEINETYTNDFNFLAPSHELANQNGRGTDGVVQPVGWWQDKYAKENDQYGDGLDDDFWYQGGGPDMMMGPYLKSSDEGNTWTPMTIEEIDLLEKSRKRNEINRGRNQANLDSEKVIKYSTPLENAYRDDQSDKQEKAVVSKNKGHIEDYIGRSRKNKEVEEKQGELMNNGQVYD